MAHNLEIRNGQASMMYVNDPPWHGLGTRLDGPATAAEALCAARLDWTVRKVPLAAYDGGKWERVPGRYAVVREDLWGKEGQWACWAWWEGITRPSRTSRPSISST